MNLPAISPLSKAQTPMISQISQPITFYFWFTKNKVGVSPSGTPTVTIARKGSIPAVVSGQNATALQNITGMYYYTLGGFSDASPDEYIAVANTSDTTVDQQQIPSLWVVGNSLANALPRTECPTGCGFPNLDLNNNVIANALHVGTAQGGTTNSLTLDAGASSTDNEYDNCIVLLTSGTGAPQFGVVTGYNGTTKVATISETWAAPDNTTTFALIANSNVGVTLASTQSFNNAGQTTPIPATYYPAATGTAPTSAAPAINGTTLPWAIDYPVSQPFSLSNVDSTGWTQFVFTIKAKNTDADSAALVTVKLTNPSSGSDGLTLINGAAPSSPTTAADGSITVSNVSGSTNLTLALTAYGHAIAAANYVWELTRYSGGANTKYRMGTGPWQATQTVRANPVAS